ncbi:MAG TPA: hypothetical protein VFD73_01160, partial [Gemmatimonadales bacterium]|nr:hypothetical protein [Gemmatimonadales bacterium]
MPGDVLFNGTGAVLAGTLIDSSQIVTFTVGSGGLLTPAPGSPFPAQATGPFGSEFRPTNPSQLFVSNAHAGNNLGSVSAFSVAANGNLKSIGASPFANLQTAPCWVEITHNGRFLFAVKHGSSQHLQLRDQPRRLAEAAGSTVFNFPTGLTPQDARLSPDGQVPLCRRHRSRQGKRVQGPRRQPDRAAILADISASGRSGVRHRRHRAIGAVTTL